MGMVAAQPAGPVQYTGQPTGPGGQPSRPLFPSAGGAGPSSSPGPKATFPAYGDQNESETKKPQLIATTGSSSKIIHPPEDISLVEDILIFE